MGKLESSVNHPHYYVNESSSRAALICAVVALSWTHSWTFRYIICMSFTLTSSMSKAFDRFFLSVCITFYGRVLNDLLLISCFRLWAREIIKSIIYSFVSFMGHYQSHIWFNHFASIRPTNLPFVHAFVDSVVRSVVHPYIHPSMDELTNGWMNE